MKNWWTSNSPEKKANLRETYEAILDIVTEFGTDVKIAPKKNLHQSTSETNNLLLLKQQLQLE